MLSDSPPTSFLQEVANTLLRLSLENKWCVPVWLMDMRAVATAYRIQGDYACYVSITLPGSLMQSRPQQGWQMYLEYTPTW